MVKLVSGTVPIAAAIISAIIVEHELEVLLRQRFSRKDDETWMELTSEQGPLSSFHSKIVAGYAFRFYDEDTAYNLHVVRTIRNTFAHAKKPIDFNHELIVDALKKIRIPTRFRKGYLSVQRIEEGGQESYVQFCFLLIIELLQKRAAAVRAKSYRERRKIAKESRVYRGGLLGALAGTMPLPQATSKLNPLLFPLDHSVDPNTEAHAGLPGAPDEKSSESGGTEDK